MRKETDEFSLPPEVELAKLKNNITGFAYVDDIKDRASKVGFDFGFVAGTQHAAHCLIEYVKQNNFNLKDFKPLIEKMIWRKLP